MDWKFVKREMSSSSDSSFSNNDTDLVSSLPGYVEFIMDLSTSPANSLCEEVLSLYSLCLKMIR